MWPLSDGQKEQEASCAVPFSRMSLQAEHNMMLKLEILLREWEQERKICEPQMQNLSPSFHFFFSEWKQVALRAHFKFKRLCFYIFLSISACAFYFLKYN